MKLSDIDESLVEAQPVGVLSRAATKLKKHMPFNKAMRDQAEGEDIANKAANELAGAFNKWLGQVKRDPDIDPKNLSPEAIMKFFTGEGFAKTAQEVIQAAVDKKRKDAGAKDKAAGTEQEPKQGTDYTDQANQFLDKDKKKGSTQQVPGYGAVNVNAESLEARLAAMLVEDDEVAVTFNPKEVNELIKIIVSKVGDDNPEGLAKRVSDIEKTGTTSSSGGDVKMSDEEFDRLSGVLGDMFEDFDDTIKKLNVDKAVREQLRKAWSDAKENAVWNMRRG